MPVPRPLETTILIPLTGQGISSSLAHFNATHDYTAFTNPLHMNGMRQPNRIQNASSNAYNNAQQSPPRAAAVYTPRAAAVYIPRAAAVYTPRAASRNQQPQRNEMTPQPQGEVLGKDDVEKLNKIRDDVAETVEKGKTIQFLAPFFKNKKNLCWLHSLTQAINRVIIGTTADGQQIKQDIIENIARYFQDGMQEDAADAFAQLVNRSKFYQDLFKAEKKETTLHNCGVHTNESRYNPNILSYEPLDPSKNFPLTSIFQVTDKNGANGKSDVIDCNFTEVTQVRTKHPGYAAALSNPKDNPIRETPFVIDPQSKKRFDLVAIIRHSNPKNRQAGHYFVDIKTTGFDTYYRIDDMRPRGDYPRAFLSDDARDGVLYFFVRHT